MANVWKGVCVSIFDLITLSHVLLYSKSGSSCALTVQSATCGVPLLISYPG